MSSFVNMLRCKLLWVVAGLFFSLPLFGAEMIGYVQSRPLQEVSKRMMNNCVRRVYPSPEIELVPMLFLGPLGYPDFPGLSTQDNVTAYFFDSERFGIDFVIAAKIAPASMMRESLEEKGFVVKDVSDVSLIMRNPNMFEDSAEYKQMLSEYVRTVRSQLKIHKEKAKFDLAVKLNLEHLSGYLEMLGQYASSNEDEEYPLTDTQAAFMAAFFDELKHLETAAFGIQFDEMDTNVYTSFAAYKETELYDLFSQRSGGVKVTGAEYVSMDDAQGVTVYKGDPFVSSQYVRHVLRNSEAYADEDEARAIWRYVGRLMDMSLKNWDGSSIKLNQFDESHGLFQRYVIGGDYMQKDLEVIGSMLENPLLSAFFAEVLSEDVDLRVEVENAFAEEQGVPLNALHVHVTFNIEDLEAWDTSLYFSEEEKLAGEGSYAWFTAAVNGSLLAASREDDLRSMIDAVLSGDTLADSVHEQLPLAPKMISRGRLDFADAFRISVISHGMDVSGFTARETLPMEFAAHTSKGNMSTYYKMPIEMLAEAGRIFRHAVQNASKPGEMHTEDTLDNE